MCFANNPRLAQGVANAPFAPGIASGFQAAARQSLGQPVGGSPQQQTQGGSLLGGATQGSSLLGAGVAARRQPRREGAQR